MKTTVNKTIPFKQRDEDKKNMSSKYKINTSNSSSKVIRYPRYKKKKDKSVKIVKNNKFIFIILGVIMFFTLLSFIDNNLLKDKYGPNGKPIKSKAQASSILVSETEFSQYSNIIENKIRSTLKLSSEHTITTNTMHKNGNYIASQGDVSLGKNNTVNFDAILKGKVFSYLVIDGTEYIK
ncbi:MAG: hypothetical protein ACRC3Y_08140 [Romboutsia sp.]|uniref:hypothetical protein n=1 Tax=Romboutsia sp. TaxID=1965302 RepID=UPI003F2F16AD